MLASARVLGAVTATLDLAGRFRFRAPARHIPVERYVDGDRYVLRAELPGIDSVDDLQVSCAFGELRLDAMREQSAESSAAHSEFRYGSLFRVIPLPAGLRSRTLAARYANGVLEVTATMGQIEPCGKAFAVPVDAGTGQPVPEVHRGANR